MKKSEVENERQAIAYLLECSLATVEGLALTKSRKVYEYTRQISIAQFAMDWARKFGADLDDEPRAMDVVKKHCGNVTEWAKSFEVKR